MYGGLTGRRTPWSYVGMCRVLRTVAIVVLAMAMLNATTGLCLCHTRGAVSLPDQAESRSCCHRSAVTVSATDITCCQIQNVPHTATSPDVVVVMQPALDSTPIIELDTRVNVPAVMALACSPSPPGRVLRV